MAYKLDLLPGSQIHDVFHVSLLKKQPGSQLPVSPQLPPVSDAAVIILQLEAVLDRCIIRKGNYRSKVEILVK